MHFYSVKNRQKIPIFSTFINNEILRNFEGKNHALINGILEECSSTERFSLSDQCQSY